MNESTLVPREEWESDLDWLARNVHVWPSNTPHILAAGDVAFEFGATFCENHVCIYHREFSDSKVIYKKQWLSRRAELQNKPSWDDAPDWVMWISQDGSGNWWIYETEPKSILDCRGGSHWSCNDGSCESLLNYSGEVLGDHLDTLEKRPADMSEQAVTARLKEATDNVLAAAPELMADKYKFEPFVSVEDAKISILQSDGDIKHFGGFIGRNLPFEEDSATANQPAITPSKYTKTIRGVSVDVYDVLQAWGVSNPALQHLIKKALQCGQRGHKDNAQDLQDIIDSAIRAKELEC